MEKMRKLPVLQLDDIPGADFFVDSLNQVLIDIQNVDNKIYLLEMINLDDHSEFIYDKTKRNLKEGSWCDFDRDDERFSTVWIRPLEVYDIEGAKLYLDQHPFTLEGLPVISIKGTDFYWSEYGEQLIQCDNPFNRICKKDTLYSYMNGEEGIYFDVNKKVSLFGYELCREMQKMRGSETVLPHHIEFISHSSLSEQVSNAKKPESYSTISDRKGPKF